MGILMMKKMNKLSLAIAAVTLASTLQAATQEQIDAAAAAAEALRGQEQQRLDLQRNQQEGDKAPSGADLGGDAVQLTGFSDANGECFELEQIKVSGSTLLDEWEMEVFEVPFLGKCITPELATAVLSSATDFYIKRGFITTRAYLPNQDLKDGVLDLFVAEGQVAETLVEAEKSLNVTPAYQVDVDQGLNIRDLEQAVDQFNAVPGNKVTMAVVPGEQPQSSTVVFENQGKPGVKGRISADNSGSESTGKNGVSISLQAGDALGLNEVWSLNLRRSVGKAEKSSHSGSLDLKIPHGYNTYGAGYSKGGFDTLLTFPTTGTELSSEGANESKYLSANRVVFRDQDSKHSVALKLKQDSVESYIAETKIDVSSRSLTSLLLSSESVLGFDQSVLVVTPEIAVGLSEVDNLPTGVNTPVENPQAEYLRYKLTLDWSQPLTLGDQPLRWKSHFVGQYADMPLYGSQQLIVGGAASVRGSHFTSIVGDQGYFWQNSLSLKQSHTLGVSSFDGEYMAGFDFGRVWSERPDVYEGGMEALVLGATWTAAPWSFGLTHSVPMNVDGDVDKGDTYTTATIGLDF